MLPAIGLLQRADSRTFAQNRLGVVVSALLQEERAKCGQRAVIELRAVFLARGRKQFEHFGSKLFGRDGLIRLVVGCSKSPHGHQRPWVFRSKLGLIPRQELLQKIDHSLSEGSVWASR